MARVTMGWLDTPGKISYLLEVTDNNHADNTRKPITDNAGAAKRGSSVVNANPRFVADKLFCPVFYDGDEYLTWSTDVSFKWNKDSNRRILTMSEHNYNATASTFSHATQNASGSNEGAGQLGAILEKLDEAKIRFEEFYLHLKFVTPKAQIQSTLNKMLQTDEEVLQIFLNKVRVTTKPHSRGTSFLTISDVFNGHILYLYLYFAKEQDYSNGDAFAPPTHHNWEGITNFHITANGQQRGPTITNSQEGYFHLRKALQLNDNQELPFNYDDYAKEYAYVTYKIPPIEDCNLKVLPLDSKTPMSVNITYTMLANRNITHHISFFHQGANFGFMKTPYKEVMY